MVLFAESPTAQPASSVSLAPLLPEPQFRILGLHPCLLHLQGCHSSRPGTSCGSFNAYVESVRGSLLIADEVGLGKTIEAIYIWKELQARAQARRLLVVCPAMLREKWRGDLRKRFGIEGTIVSAQELARDIGEVASGDKSRALVLICSIEAIRLREDNMEPLSSLARHRFARLLKENPATEDDALFDLVIVDEAHYIRNPATANNHIVRILRDASRNMVLLSATPLQTSSENLFNLLKMVNPELFTDSLTFQRLFGINRPLILAMRALGSTPPDLAAAHKSLEESLQSVFFSDDAVLKNLDSLLQAGMPLSREQLAEYQALLESRSLFSQFFIRSRKRDIQERRVIRDPTTLQIAFSPPEKKVYQTITDYLRGRYTDAPPAAVFALIARQRLMASCIVAAIESWSEKGDLEEILQEVLGGDLGLEGSEQDTLDFPDLPAPELVGGISIDELRRNDTKVNTLLEQLERIVRENPGEKVVVFTSEIRISLQCLCASMPLSRRFRQMFFEYQLPGASELLRFAPRS